MSTDTRSTPEMALALDDAQFEKLVASQLAPGARNQHAWSVLTHPDVIHRTHDALESACQRSRNILKDKSLEMEMFRENCEEMGTAGGVIWKEGRAQRMRSFRGTSQFLHLAEGMLQQVRQRIAAEATSSDEREARGKVRRASQALQRLTAKVLDHEDEMANDPSQADEELWALLDEVKIILNGRPATLREAHKAGWGNE